MNWKQVVTRIDELRAANTRISSERALSLEATGNPDFLRHLRSGKNNEASTTHMLAISRLLGTSLDEILAAGDDHGEVLIGGRRLRFDRVEVIGAVEAGPFREAVEWEPQYRRQLMVSPDPRVPPGSRFGLDLRGDSLDRLYPFPQTTAICTPLRVLGRDPLPGEVVVVYRRRHDLIEATCKVFAPRGERIWLEPRSTNTSHEPIRVARTAAELREAKRANAAVAWDNTIANGPEDVDTVAVAAVVTGAEIVQ